MVLLNLVMLDEGSELTIDAYDTLESFPEVITIP